LQEDEDRVARACEMSMRATNTLCLCLDGIDSRRSEVYLLESPAKLIAQRTVYLQGEESVANCVNPIRKRAALINVLGGPASWMLYFDSCAHSSDPNTPS